MSLIRSIAVGIGIACLVTGMAGAEAALQPPVRMEANAASGEVPAVVARALAAGGWERVAGVARWLPTAGATEIRSVFLKLVERREFQAISGDAGTEIEPDLTLMDARLLRGLLLLRWCELNPPEAIAWATSTQHEPAAWEAWTMVDPEASLGAALATTDSPISFAEIRVLPTLARMDPERAQALLAPDAVEHARRYEGYRSELMEAICQGVAREDFGAACLRALKWDRPIKSRLIREFARRDLTGALAWAQGRVELGFRVTALADVLAVWARQDPDETARFIEALPVSRRKFRFWVEHAQRLALEGAEPAAVWADRAPHPVARNRSLAAAAAVRAKENPADALTLLLRFDRNEPGPYVPTLYLPPQRQEPMSGCFEGSPIADFDRARNAAARWFPLDAMPPLSIYPTRPRQSGAWRTTPWDEESECPTPVYDIVQARSASQISPFPILDLVPMLAVRASAVLRSMAGDPWLAPPRTPSKPGLRLVPAKPVRLPHREWIDEMAHAPSASARAASLIDLAERTPPEDLPRLADWAFLLPEPTLAHALERAALNRWLRQDPTSALSWVFDTDPTSLAAAVEAWATLDPMAALAWFETTLLPESSTRVPLALAKGLAPVDPGRAFQILHEWELTDPDEVARLTYPLREHTNLDSLSLLGLQLAFEAIARNNPLKLVQESRALGREFQSMARAAALSRWADQNPVQAAAWAAVCAAERGAMPADTEAFIGALFQGDLTTGEKLDRLLALPTIAHETAHSGFYDFHHWRLWLLGDPWHLLPHLHRDGKLPPALRIRLLQELACNRPRWFDKNPLPALAAMDSVARDCREIWLLGNHREDHLLGYCAAADPDATAQWIRSHLKGSQRSEALAFVDSQRKQDTPRSQTAKTPPPPPDPTSVVDEEAAGWVRQFEHGGDHLADLSPEERRSLVALASSPSVADRLSSDSKADGSRRDFLGSMADRSPAETAMGLAPDLPDDEFMMNLCISIATRWASESPREAADWAASLPSETSVKSWAIRNAVSEWRCLDIETAEQWLAQHPDPEVRESVPTLRR